MYGVFEVILTQTGKILTEKIWSRVFSRNEPSVREKLLEMYSALKELEATLNQFEVDIWSGNLNNGLPDYRVNQAYLAELNNIFVKFRNSFHGISLRLEIYAHDVHAALMQLQRGEDFYYNTVNESDFLNFAIPMLIRDGPHATGSGEGPWGDLDYYCVGENVDWEKQREELTKLSVATRGIIGEFLKANFPLGVQMYRKEMGQDRSSIVMGNQVNITGSNITASDGSQIQLENFDRVVTKMEEGGAIALATLFKDLVADIVQTQSIPPSQRIELVEVIEHLGTEVAKPNRNKTMLRSLGEGLTASLKIIPDLTKAADAVAKLLGPYL